MAEIVELAEKNGEIVMLEDGFWYYWLDNKGAIPAYQLRQLADELDKRNEKWEQQIDEYFRNQSK